MEPEKVAYWYFRLNGFLQLENFIIHPPSAGGQRTDADILGVRFPNRAERFVDDPNDIMADDVATLRLTETKIDVVIAEVKTGLARLNGPWTDVQKQNIDRVVAAIGCVSAKKINRTATALYQTGLYDQGNLRVRLVAVGGARNPEIAARYPEVAQVVWPEVLNFIWGRFRKYAQQKADVQQWDVVGRELKDFAEGHSREEFRNGLIASFG